MKKHIVQIIISNKNNSPTPLEITTYNFNNIKKTKLCHIFKQPNNKQLNTKLP